MDTSQLPIILLSSIPIIIVLYFWSKLGAKQFIIRVVSSTLVIIGLYYLISPYENCKRRKKDFWNQLELNAYVMGSEEEKKQIETLREISHKVECKRITDW